MDPDNPETMTPRPRRRWRSYSLRSLLLLTTLAAIVLGVWVNRAERQRRAVAAIRKAGGGVEDGPEPNPPSHFRRWLTTWLGDEYVADVVRVKCRRGATPWLPMLG